MARKTTINLPDLAALGAEKLAQLVLDETERDAGFRKLVAAALAGRKGPKAVAALIDRRLGSLERARGLVEWDKARVFEGDLDATVTTIVDELGPADATAAAERLVRFIATHRTVFERVDDSHGRIQGVYETAIAALEPLTASMPDADCARLPDIVMAALTDETHGYLPMVVAAVAKSIPIAALALWDADLAASQTHLSGLRDGARDWEREGRISGTIASRQAIAEARGDLDGFIALEEAKHPNVRNAMAIAERLLAAGRADDALVWVRREGGRRIGHMTHADVADGGGVRDLASGARVRLEARILAALGDHAAAQSLRWSSFEETLDAEMLREHVAHLDDFAEFDVLDRAFDHASAAPASYRALAFFIDWPRLDRAARLVEGRREGWDGRHYGVLVPAAEALEVDHPRAATILYRALLADILSRAKSAAYGHAARYLARLDALAEALGAGDVAGMDHAAYRAGLAKSHARKAGFWAQIGGKRGKAAQSQNGGWVPTT